MLSKLTLVGMRSVMFIVEFLQAAGSILPVAHHEVSGIIAIVFAVNVVCWMVSPWPNHLKTLTPPAVALRELNGWMWFVFFPAIPIAITEVTMRSGFMRWYWLVMGILSLVCLRWLRRKVEEPVAMTLFAGSLTVITGCVALMGVHGPAQVASGAIAIAGIITTLIFLEMCDSTILHRDW